MKKLALISGKILLGFLALYGAVQVTLPLVRIIVLATSEYRRVPSPDSKYELVFVLHSAGAATRGLRQIFLVEFGGSPRDGEKIVEVYSGNKMVATWNSPNKVVLNIAGSVQVSDLVSRVHRYDVSVETHVRYIALPEW